MALGIALYVGYRRSAGMPLRERVVVSEAALRSEPARAEYGSILVPIFGTPLDDDIVQTAGRLAAAEDPDEGEGHGATIEAIWVFEVPLSLPLDARLPDTQLKAARAALARAKAVGEEYEGVEVDDRDRPRAARRRGDRQRGGAARRRADRARRRGAVADPRRRAAGRHRRAAGQLRRRRDEVRRAQGAVPRDPHRAGDRPARRTPTRLHSAPLPSSIRRMMVLVVGAGRVGAAVAKSSLAAGHTVSVLDEDPLSHERLDAGQPTSWEDAGGRFTVGTAIEIDALLAAGIEEADIFIAATRGDNTNLLVAQIAQKRFGVAHVIVRVLDPARSDWYAEQGLHTICAVKLGIAMFEKAIPDVDGALMYVIVVGGGKVGLNLARELIRNGQEVTLVEADRRAYLRIEQELEHAVQYGDGTELWVLERAGIQRADLVVAVTGDDEDNILICQVAKEKYLCERIIARCNNPRNLQHFKLLGIQPAVSATDLILNLIEHEVPGHGLVHLLDLPDEKLEIIEVEVDRGRARGGPAGLGDRPARRQPRHLRPAARQGRLRPQGRHRDQPRRRGARRARPGSRAAHHGAVRAQRPRGLGPRVGRARQRESGQTSA